MNPVFFKNRHLSRLETNETKVLAKLLPYWGLLFNETRFAIEPALTGKTVCLEHSDERVIVSLKETLKHSGLFFTHTPNDEVDFHCNVRLEKKNNQAPIRLQIGNMKYRLKLHHQIELQTTQKKIHRNLWLPERHRFVTITFYNRSTEEQTEALAYLIIQYFLRKQMSPLQTVSLEQYAHLIEKVLLPINPSFAALQAKTVQQTWPDIPPEIANDQLEVKKSSFSEDEASPFNPFQQKSSSPKQINPFSRARTTPASQINPFKRK